MKHFLRSFRYALRGVIYALRREHNFQIEVVFSIIVFVLAVCFRLSTIERSVLFAMMAGVLALELINTAMERLVDMTRPRVHPYAKVVKDIMAGAVLVMALFSVLIGFVIFFPRVADLLR